MVITTDVGSTLGTFTQPGSVDILAAIAEKHRGAKRSMVAEICRWKLHVAPTLTEQLITDVCHYLMIPRDAWPESFPSGFTAYPDADETLAEIAKLGPIVAISNVSVLTGPDRMDALHSQLGHHLDGIYASYAIATRKPHPRCWQYAAARHGCTVDDIVHIGDRIPEDIDGALRAGCRGAIFTNTRRINVPDYLSTDPRVAIVPDLRGALSVAQQWYRACRDRVARDQRPTVTTTYTRSEQRRVIGAESLRTGPL